jgi:cytochrome c-type biogenesis protein CcmH/NrfG
MNVRRHFQKKWVFFLWLFLFVFGVGAPGCDKQPSNENKTMVSPPAPHPELSANGDSGEDHPGTGPMAEINRYRERLKTNPADMEALIFLANSNFDINRFEKAKDLYIQALSIDPKNPSVRTDLATCFRKLGQSDQAVVELKTVLALKPDHPPALYNLGMILLNDKGDKKGALQAWQRLVKVHPEHELAHGLAEKINLLKKEGEAPPG